MQDNGVLDPRAGQMSGQDKPVLLRGVRSYKWLAQTARNLSVYLGTYHVDRAHQQWPLLRRLDWVIWNS